MNFKQTLILEVLNSYALDSGRLSYASFTNAGGIIGSAPNNKWCIQNRQQTVATKHVEIIFTDASFCIKSYFANAWLNGMDLFANSKLVRLQHGDLLNLCDLQIQISIGEQNDLSSSENKFKDIICELKNPVENILDNQQELLTDNYADDKNIFTNLKSNYKNTNGAMLDPLKILDAGKPNILDETINVSSLKSHFGNVLDHLIVLNCATITDHKNKQNDDGKTPDILASLDCMFKSLGFKIDIHNKDAYHALLMAIGASIRVVIAGLRRIYNSNCIAEVINSSLQQKLNDPNILNVLYQNSELSDGSAASDFIAQSLAGIESHCRANKKAIKEALAHLLKEYSSCDSKLDVENQGYLSKLFWQIYQDAYKYHLDSMSCKY